MTANDCYRPPIDAQLRYTVQWFHEWSEMQRGDFLPILAQKLSPGNYVNGLLSGVETLSCNEGRPPSLFQCRIKLFREWFGTWSQAEREQLLNHIKSMDPGFYDKIQEELQTINRKTGNGPVPAESTDEEPPIPDQDKQDDLLNGEPVDQAIVAVGDDCEDHEESAVVPTENGDE